MPALPTAVPQVFDSRYGIPVHPEFKIPVEPDLQIPVQPDLQIPVQPDFQIPVQPDFQVPVEPDFAMSSPMQKVFIDGDEFLVPAVPQESVLVYGGNEPIGGVRGPPNHHTFWHDVHRDALE